MAIRKPRSPSLVASSLKSCKERVETVATRRSELQLQTLRDMTADLLHWTLQRPSLGDFSPGDMIGLTIMVKNDCGCGQSGDE